jgi:hypothetical protein
MDTNRYNRKEQKTMKKVLEINGDGGLFCKVMEDYTKRNPYRIYKVWWATDADGRYRKHQKLVEEYGDFASVLCYLRDDALGINEGGKLYGSTCRMQ